MDEKSFAEYRQELPYDAMGDYSVFVQKDSQEEEPSECETKEE